MGSILTLLTLTHCCYFSVPITSTPANAGDSPTGLAASASNMCFSAAMAEVEAKNNNNQPTEKILMLWMKLNSMALITTTKTENRENRGRWGR